MYMSMCYAYYILYESKDEGNDGYDNDQDDDCDQNGFGDDVANGDEEKIVMMAKAVLRLSRPHTAT